MIKLLGSREYVYLAWSCTETSYNVLRSTEKYVVEVSIIRIT